MCAEQEAVSRDRRHIYYSGRVQGVGFRYTVQSIAGGFEVVGFVKNLPDGRVELVVEGATGELSGFLGEVSRVMDRNIENAAITESSATGEFAAFNVTY